MSGIPNIFLSCHLSPSHILKILDTSAVGRCHIFAFLSMKLWCINRNDAKGAQLWCHLCGTPSSTLCCLVLFPQCDCCWHVGQLVFFAAHFVERSWTIIALKTLIFYFWSNIEPTWHECSFITQITIYKEKNMKQICLTYFKIGLILSILLVTLNTESFWTKIYFKIFLE